VVQVLEFLIGSRIDLVFYFWRRSCVYFDEQCCSQRQEADMPLHLKTYGVTLWFLFYQIMMKIIAEIQNLPTINLRIGVWWSSDQNSFPQVCVTVLHWQTNVYECRFDILAATLTRVESFKFKLCYTQTWKLYTNINQLNATHCKPSFLWHLICKSDQNWTSELFNLEYNEYHCLAPTCHLENFWI